MSAPKADEAIALTLGMASSRSRCSRKKHRSRLRVSRTQLDTRLGDFHAFLMITHEISRYCSEVRNHEVAFGRGDRPQRPWLAL